MAALHNTAQDLRFLLVLHDLERSPGSPGRVLASAAVEWLDRRDQTFWPFLQLPVLHVAPEDGEALEGALAALCADQRPGFAFRAGSHEELALHLARTPAGSVRVEVGVDLGSYLRQVSQSTRVLPATSGGAAEELALFRFEASQAELVRFTGALRDERARLVGSGSGP